MQANTNTAEEAPPETAEEGEGGKLLEVRPKKQLKSLKSLSSW